MKDLASVLVKREETANGQEWWTAQVLEYDLATQAQTVEDLAYELHRILVAHIVCCEQEGVIPFESLPPAPQSYRDEYKKSSVKLTVEIQRIASSTAMTHKPPELEMRLSA